MAENNAGSTLLAFVVGAAAGAVTSLLLAPRSGRETRRQIGQAGEAWLSRARDLAEDANSLYQDALNKARQQSAYVGGVLKKERDAAAAAIKAGKEAWEDRQPPAE
jgi:gas vesicle protein